MQARLKAGDERGPQASSGGPSARKPFRWGFASSAGMVLVLMLAGQLAGWQLESWPPARALMFALRGDRQGAGELLSGLLAAMGPRDWVFAAFLVSTAVYLVLMRSAVARFFRTMQVGVALIAFATLSILAGVLVPQIQNFEDPEERVTPENYESNFADFAWAESYFLYHLLRPYGLGMPAAVVPPAAEESLERFGRVYGEEERANREKMMRAAFAGGSKTDEIEAWRRAHDGGLRRAFDLCTFLQLNRAYKSHWFATLMALIAAGTALNALRPGMSRKWFTIHKLGFFVTHVGVLVLLAGGLISHLMTDRGILELYLGEPPEDTYYRHYRSDKLARMPFALELEHFARKEWMALEVHSLQEDFRSKPPRFTLWPGREIPLDFRAGSEGGEERAQLLLRVRELHDHAVVGTPRVYEGLAEDGDPAYPVVALEVFEAAAEDRDGAGGQRVIHLSPLQNRPAYHDPEGRFRLAAAYDQDPQALFPDESHSALGTLYVEVRTQPRDRPLPVPVRLGQTVEIPGGYRLEFVDATSDLDVRKADRATIERGSPDPRPLSEQPYRFAAVWVDIHPSGGGESERRLVIEVVDALEYGLQDDYALNDVIARLRWDRWTAPGPPRFVLGYGPAQAALLVGQDGSRAPAPPGEALALPGPTRVVPSEFLHFARFEKNIRFAPRRVGPGGWDESFYSRDARGLVLEVVHFPGTERELREDVSMASTEVGNSEWWLTGDQRYALRFLENTEGFPFDWRSVLAVWERDAGGRLRKLEGQSPDQREIRVNDYFRHRGYRFFQTNADPAKPTYSGIGVVYDPGIPVVLAGMYTIIAGTVLAFLVRPIVLARRRAGAAA